MSLFNSLKNNNNAIVMERNIILLENICYHKCIKCKGSGNVIWGICYDCNGKGVFHSESLSDYNKRVEISNNEWMKYKQSEKYREDEKQNEFQSLVLIIQHHKDVTEYDSNFAYIMNCWKFNKVSVKQRNILLKLSLKYHNELEQLKFKELLKV